MTLFLDEDPYRSAPGSWSAIFTVTREATVFDLRYYEATKKENHGVEGTREQFPVLYSHTWPYSTILTHRPSQEI